ncbi:unnamed protein product [Mytilus edulis]|uniref:Uncharacterized protein n=1 Tax=Mytilus edulis TaxID=6550 RepID=A0A8S3QT77_MYTED|nr:unnamed protein product [Mytilus edulis]
MANEKEKIFTEELLKMYNEKCDRVLMPKEKLNIIISRFNILCESETIKRTRDDYNLLSRYEVLQIAGLEKLIRKRKTEEDPILYFVSLEETFDVIKKSHSALNHAGRDKMQKELNKKYANTLQQEEDLNFEMTTRHHGLVSQSSNEDLVAQDYQLVTSVNQISAIPVVNSSLPDSQPTSEISDTSDRQPIFETQDSQQSSYFEAALLDIIVPQSNSVDDETLNEVQCLQYERECNKCSAFFQTDSILQICCDICVRSECIQRERHASGSNLSKQAEKMVARSNQILRPVQVGDNVTVPIPSVDRGRGDPRNLLCIVLEHDQTNDQFKLGSKDGILNGSYSRNQFTFSPIHSLALQDANTLVELSVREAARQQSIGDGQGFLKCACKTGCVRKTCKCVKSNVLCNSRCHNSLSCHNK